MQAGTQLDMIAALVRTGDRDRYLAALFAPVAARGALLALHAFNIELARVAEVSREPLLGEMRLQWWRDALQMAGRGERVGQPTADALGEAMRAFGLPPATLLGMIDARTFDVSGDVMPDWPALKTYLGKTAGASFALAAHILLGAPLASEGAAREAGLAFGLTGLLRSLPLHRARGRLYLPAARLDEFDVDPQAVLSGRGSDQLDRALADLRAEARAALGRARTALRDVPRAGRTAFLPLALVEPYLAALAHRRHRPLTEIADIAPLRRLWRITRAAVTGRV